MRGQLQPGSFSLFSEELGFLFYYDSGFIFRDDRWFFSDDDGFSLFRGNRFAQFFGGPGLCGRLYRFARGRRDQGTNRRAVNGLILDLVENALGETGRPRIRGNDNQPEIRPAAIPSASSFRILSSVPDVVTLGPGCFPPRGLAAPPPKFICSSSPLATSTRPRKRVPRVTTISTGS